MAGIQAGIQAGEQNLLRPRRNGNASLFTTNLVLVSSEGCFFLARITNWREACSHVWIRKLMRKGVFILSLVVLVAGTVWACLSLARPPALLFAGEEMKGPGHFSGKSTSKRYKFVRVNRAVLDRVSEGLSEFELELFDGRRHKVYLGQQDSTATGGTLNYGRLAEIPGSQVVLATQKEAMAGGVYLPDGRKFYFNYLGHGIHVLREVDYSLAASSCQESIPGMDAGYTVGPDGVKYQKYFQVRTVIPWGGTNSPPPAPPVPKATAVVNNTAWGPTQNVLWGGQNWSVRRSLRRGRGFSVPPQPVPTQSPMGTVSTLVQPGGSAPLPPKNPPWVPTGANVPGSGPMIEIMICWTPAAKAAKGGANGISALCNAAVGELNLGFRNGQASAQAQLVGTFEYANNSAGNVTTDLDAYRQNAAVQAERDRLSADIVSLFVEDNQTGILGVAYGSSTLSPSSEMQCWNVVQLQAVTGSFHSFAHETGHNLGCMHHKDQSNPGSGPFTYSHGWRWAGNDGNRYRSLLSYQSPSYSNEPRIIHFSNPAVSYKGVPTGDAQKGNNAATINATAPIISKFRPKTP